MSDNIWPQEIGSLVLSADVSLCQKRRDKQVRKCPKVGALSSRCLINRQFAKCPNLGKWLIIMFFNTLFARGEA